MKFQINSINEIILNCLNEIYDQIIKWSQLLNIVITFNNSNYITYLQIFYCTALHAAAKKGNLEIVNLLMQVNGIDIYVKDEV